MQFKIPANLIALLIGILTAFCLLLAGVAAIEWKHAQKKDLFTRWHDANSQFDPEIGWAPIPARSVIDDAHKISIKNNHLGLRSDEIIDSKEKILLLGDSVVWGYGVNDHETAASHLSQLMKDRYQVVNLGVSGYGIDQSYLFFERNLSGLRFVKHVVLVIYTENDRDDTRANQSYGKQKPLFRLIRNQLVLTGTPIHQFCWRNILSISYFLNRIVNRFPKVGKILGKFTGYQQLSDDESEAVIVELIKKIQSMSESKGASFHLVLSPSAKNFPEISSRHQWFREILMKNNLPFADHVDLLKSETGISIEEIYLEGDIAHFTSRGNELLARTIDQTLIETGLASEPFQLRAAKAA